MNVRFQWLMYGYEALKIVTTVKLGRVLWIFPISFLFTLTAKGENKKIKIPYFIGLFILVIIINTYLPHISEIAPYIVSASKKA